jgi:transcription elongation GreA/GreB family factor
MLDKSLIFQKCVDVLEERIKQIQGERAQVQASANDETKSSVGDKYETGRAMAQLEIERFTQQLIENEKLLNRLQELKEVQACDRIVPGSLVHTSQGYFYISVSLGMIEWDGHRVYCISPEAPLGKELLGKRAGDRVTINGRIFQVMATG